MKPRDPRSEDRDSGAFSLEDLKAEAPDRLYAKDVEALWRDYGEVLAPGKIVAYRQMGLDAVFGRREGVVFENLGRPGRWINCHCNAGVFNLGHRNPRIIEAVQRSLDHLDIGNHHLVSPWRAALARRLAASTDGRLPAVVFAVAGGEAMDLAIKVCRGTTGRPRVISVAGGYHGHTGLAMAVGDRAYRDPFGIFIPGFEQVPFDDLGALDAAIDDSVAAVVLEPIPATLGMPMCADDYLPGVERLCRDRGARLILDEVQTGLGRTGKMWAFQHWDLTPDAVVTGKGLSGGVYPISATLLSEELLALFNEYPFAHISTFGGAEPGCVAALTVLDILEEPGFLERVLELSDRIADRIERLPLGLRRKGLMMGVEFGRPEAAIAATQALYREGVFAVWAGNDPSVLQFLPPLVISDDELETVLTIFERLWGRG